MLNAIRAFLIGATSALILCASAGAITVDMSYPGPTDPYLVVPMPGDTAWVARADYMYVYGDTRYVFQGNPASAIISMPDGSMWTSAGDESSMAHIPSGFAGPPEYLPALPSGGEPSSWARAADGTLWFTEVLPSELSRTPDVIGRLNPTTHAVTEFGGLSAGALAQTIVAGPDGNLWFLEPGTNSIGRITTSGIVTEFPLPTDVRPATFRRREMTVGPGGDLYFLTTAGIARMTTSGTLVGAPNNGGLPDFQPNALAYGRDGNLWATECAADSVDRISPAGTITRSPEGTFVTGACPMGITSTSDGTPWLYQWNVAYSTGPVVFESPLVTTDDPTDVDPTAADLNGEAAPRGAATTVRFEYGATTGYGRATPDQVIGDGDGAVPVSARPTDLMSSTTYHYRLVAHSTISTVYGTDQTVTTAAAPPPPPPPPPVDRDGDGFAQAVDCDDLSAAVHPGADDTPGDRVDQDCSGADATYERFQPHAKASWKTVHGRIVFTKMVIDAMPAGSSLKLSCAGKGCVKAGYRTTIAKSVRRLDVVKHLHNARLGKSAEIELTFSRPGYITTIVRWTIGPPPKVTTLCQPPGTTKPTAC